MGKSKGIILYANLISISINNSNELLRNHLLQFLIILLLIFLFHLQILDNELKIISYFDEIINAEKYAIEK